jgi:FtsZ-binding cell division protein ZapB
MNFNYQNVEVEEESAVDFRKYGLLNRSLIDDEMNNELDTIKVLNDEIESLKNRNKVVEELCQNLRNNMKTILENSTQLENELNNTRKKLVETEFLLKKLMEKINGKN